MLKPRRNIKATPTPAQAARRSPCPVACALDIFGDRWSLLIVRDLALGRQRFQDFLDSPEGIPTNILAERLLRLSRRGIIDPFPSRPGSTRMNYRLSRKGESLLPALRAICEWGLKWEKGTRVSLSLDPPSDRPLPSKSRRSIQPTSRVKS